MKKQVAIVIPIHLEEPSEMEKISLSQTLSILHNYPVVFQAKEGLNTKWYEEFCYGKATVSFERFSWNGLMGYTELLLSPELYSRFKDYEYILICHLDVFVFRDELEKWCQQGYDYIGSVVYNTTWTALPSRFGKLIGLERPEYIANGGFGLRKVESFINLTTSNFLRSKLLLWKLRHNKFFQDDILLSQLSRKLNSKGFKIATKSVAEKFGAAVELWDEKDLPFANRDSSSLPFGIHGWFNYHPDFWKPCIRAYGHTVYDSLFPTDKSLLKPKLLTIAIPSYNRAGLLNDQLTRLSNDMKGFEDDCDIVVNDNCSTDNTPGIINGWHLIFQELGITFTANNQDHHIGAMANVVASLNSATGDYVWTLGNDDVIQPGTIPYIVGLLKKYGNLALIMLDGIGRDQQTMEIKHECFFDSTTDKPVDGASKFEHFLEHGLAGVLFISNAIYNTKLVKEALISWPNSSDNLAAQAYWVAYCAARGSFIVTPTRHTETAMGIGCTDLDKHWHLKIKFTCVPEVYLRLMLAGYSRVFCLKNITANLRSMGAFRVLMGGMRRWFAFSINSYFDYLRFVLLAIRLNFTLSRLEKLKRMI